ncbi:histidine phosphatase family protein [Pseudomonas sp. 21LCFQ02]|uniref:histidine phosphatase family protein n=1 Tax=Pseudomonas sp. 21LCFQ02 TaxID=2957505 RepID=UPI00209A922F|nr:histidine phosphatase family protein [Pseudomonas sp. 21LCFQ02]MCO8171441.1 histidine phosphatase family protein [Pseudomonas sp. 21LCFQ02]
MTLQLYVVRHGQTWANREGRYLGALDAELTEDGRQQAEALRNALPAQIDVLVSSPLLRARQTAEILNQSLNLPLVVDKHFRERNVGVFEGLTQAEARTRYPQLWARNITRQWQQAPDGGETIAEVVERVRLGLNGLVERHAGSTVVLVAHGFVGKTVRALVRGDFSDFFDWQLENGQLLALENVGGIALPTSAVI